MPTYWVRKVGGNNSSDGLSIENAWDAEDGIAKWLDEGTTSDSLKVVADGIYAPAATFAWDGFGGAAAAYSMMIGVNELGVEDGTQAVINGADISSADCLAISGGFDYIGIRNIRITGATDDGISVASGCDYLSFYNVTADASAQNGLSLGGLSASIIKCVAHSNGVSGIDCSTYSVIDLCSIYGNTTYGIKSS